MKCKGKLQRLGDFVIHYQYELKLITVFLKLVAEGLIGMAIVGGAAAIAIGGLVGLGVALSKK